MCVCVCLYIMYMQCVCVCVFYNIDLDQRERERESATHSPFYLDGGCVLHPQMKWSLGNEILTTASQRLVSESRRLSVPLFSSQAVCAHHRPVGEQNGSNQPHANLMQPRAAAAQIGLGVLFFCASDRTVKNAPATYKTAWLIAEPKEWESRLIYGHDEKARTLLSFRLVLTCVCKYVCALDKCLDHCIADKFYWLKLLSIMRPAQRPREDY